ncbi:tyrosine-protein kinase receptor Tie-1-like isoform X2 [Argiope bruennichi]|nr:tyrosine-protein kinase receptor Tie-1-like isoform X2 [Argiope bruennichi]
MWNSSERTVTFQRDQPKNVFFGSKRMHISSNLKDVHEAGDAISSYKFLSPYISENLLDVASLHTDYLFGEKGLHNQFCFVSKKSTNLKFDQYCNTNIEKPCVLLATRGGVGLLQAEWKVETKNDEKLNAGYQCFPENKTLSTLTSLAFRKDAYFYPTTLTKTVSVHEEVTLQMTENGVCGDKATVWRKDRGHAITQDVSRTSIFFPKVEVGHAGIYSLECSNSDVSRAGFVHLIVRACPNGKHGNLCSKDCPECLNGGICHDLNGECVCPPGFYGPMCEKACPSGTFGRNCNMKCSSSPFADEMACKGASICLPHPYGCSCGAGFKGIFCNETCKPGTFGAGCTETRQCHCSNGKGCDIFTGSCDGECADNWFGKHCDNYMAALSFDSPSSSAVNLTWKAPSEFILLLFLVYSTLNISILGGIKFF